MVSPVCHNGFCGECFLHFLIDVQDGPVLVDGVLQVRQVWEVGYYVGDSLLFVLILGGVFEEFFTRFGSGPVDLAGDIRVCVSSLLQFGGEFFAGCFEFFMVGADSPDP